MISENRVLVFVVKEWLPKSAFYPKTYVWVQAKYVCNCRTKFVRCAIRYFLCDISHGYLIVRDFFVKIF